MARAIIDTTAGAGDTAKAGGDKINANFVELYARVAALEAGTGSPTLGTLTLSTALQSGTAVSGNILGATASSTIASNISGITVNSAARTYSGTPTGGAQTIANGLVETLAGAVGSPRSSSISVAAAGATAPTATFAMTQLAAPDRIYQRSTDSGGGQSKGQGTVRVTISGASAGTINARCRSAADGVTIVQSEWQAATIANAATTANIAGVDARLGWFYLDTKGSDGAWKLGTVAIGMGALTMMGSAQSLGLRMFKSRSGSTIAALGLTPPANGRCYAMWAGESDDMTSPVWTKPDTAALYDSAGAVQWLNNMITELGVNCGFCGFPVGGAPSSSFTPAYGNRKQSMIDIVNAIGGFETYMVFIGHTDSSQGALGHLIRSNLSGAMDLCTARNHRGNNFKAVVASIPSNTGTTQWGTLAQKEYVRRVTYDWTLKDCAPRLTGGAAYAQNGTATLYDQVHQDNGGAIVLANALFDAWKNGSHTGDATLTGPAPIAVSSVNPATPTYATGKRYSQALQHDSFQLGDGGAAGGGVISIGMRVYLTAYQDGSMAFSDGGRSGYVFVRSDGAVSFKNNANSTIKMPLNRWFDLVWTKIAEDPFGGTGSIHQIWIDGVKATEDVDANLLAGEYYMEGPAAFRQFNGGGYWWDTGVKSEAHGVWHRHLYGVIPDIALTGQEPGINAFATGNGALVGAR